MDNMAYCFGSMVLLSYLTISYLCAVQLNLVLQKYFQKYWTSDKISSVHSDYRSEQMIPLKKRKLFNNSGW